MPIVSEFAGSEYDDETNDGGRNKLRPGDVLGALTADGGVRGEAVGSID